MSIAVVTDSTAYLPPEYVERHSVRVVPLHVSVDGAEPLREPDFDAGSLVAALAGRRRVTTAGAASAEFAEVYRAALDSGAEGVVSIHLSQLLSGTCDAARLAASEVSGERVRVVDSRSTAMGLGFAVLAAASSAERGCDLATVAAHAERRARRSTTLFSLQTLEYLRRGGRIGTAATVLGTALSIKPLLRVDYGRIKAVEKVRTTERAMSRLVELAVAAAGHGPARVAVHHLAVPQRAEQLSEQLGQRFRVDCVTEVGAVIGAHVGPGALGVVVLPD